MKKDELLLEHYKSMRQEYMHLMLYNQKLWNYKLSALGAVIAITIFNEKLLEIEKFNTEILLDPALIISIGLLTLPVIALLIDLKTLEMAMQMKLISNHISQKYKSIEEIKEWEDGLWKVESIVSYTRTRLSLILYVGTSVVILILSFFTVGILQNDWILFLILLGGFLIALPIIGMFTFLPRLFKRT